MSRKIFASVGLVILAVFCYGHTLAGMQEFSADMISESGGRTNKTKIYASDGKIRTEAEGNIIIIRPDKQLSWIIMPSQRAYMEQPFNPDMMPKVSGKIEGETEREPLGSENVNGVFADKFKVTYADRGGTTSMYQWLNSDEFPVKMQALDGSWSVEYRNISSKAQPDSLFELPEGYEKMAMPSLGSGKMPSLSEIMSQAE